MNLIINNFNNLYDEKFILFLIGEIQEYFLSQIDDKKLIKWTEYINQNIKFNKLFKKHINAKDIIISGIYNLRYRKLYNKYIIEIDDNVLVSDTDIKLNSLCKTINFGTLSMRSYPIFYKVFNDIQINLQSYYKQYLQDEVN